MLTCFFADTNFTVGIELKIKMKIKPNSKSGLLAAVYSKKDFIILQLVEGQITFTVDNGNGPVTTYSEPVIRSQTGNHWHNITGKVTLLSFHEYY